MPRVAQRKRILIAWETGGNFGHAAEIAQLLPHLGRDHEIVAAVRDPATLRAIVSDRDIRITAAPHAPPASRAPSQRILSFVDMTRYIGWQTPRSLAAYLEAWDVLFDLVRPDIVVTQAAPTALLAARAVGLPRVAMGSGYCCPPRADPMPAFDPDAEADPAERLRAEERTVALINAALRTRDLAPIAAFREILDAEGYLLTTLPELDHYADRPGIEPDHPPYLGPIVGTHFGTRLEWRGDGQDRILAYLRPGSASFEATVRALASLPPTTDVILAAPGASEQLARRVAGTAIRAVPGPVDFGPLLEGCDLGIGHASNGLAANFALAGVPQIGLPTQSEQTMMARTLSRSGLGIGITGKPAPEHILQAIRLLKASEKVAGATAALARAWSENDATLPSRRSAEAILTLLGA